MKQLKMLWRCRETAYPDNPWQGFRYRPFSGSEEDVRAWLDICKNGLLPPDAGEEYYRDLLVNWRDYRTRDTWLVEMGGSPVATVTAIVHPGSPAGLCPYGGGRSFLQGPGGGRTDEPHRLRRFLGSGCETADLTTDDFRIPAIRKLPVRRLPAGGLGRGYGRAVGNHSAGPGPLTGRDGEGGRAARRACCCPSRSAGSCPLLIAPAERKDVSCPIGTPPNI